jgi:hypothetical protein
LGQPIGPIFKGQESKIDGTDRLSRNVGKKLLLSQFYSFFNLGARWGGWSTTSPVCLTPKKETRYRRYFVFMHRKNIRIVYGPMSGHDFCFMLKHVTCVTLKCFRRNHRRSPAYSRRRREDNIQCILHK